MWTEFFEKDNLASLTECIGFAFLFGMCLVLIRYTACLSEWCRRLCLLTYSSFFSLLSRVSRTSADCSWWEMEATVSSTRPTVSSSVPTEKLERTLNMPRQMPQYGNVVVPTVIAVLLCASRLVVDCFCALFCKSADIHVAVSLPAVFRQWNWWPRTWLFVNVASLGLYFG